MAAKRVRSTVAPRADRWAAQTADRTAEKKAGYLAVCWVVD